MPNATSITVEWDTKQNLKEKKLWVKENCTITIFLDAVEYEAAIDSLHFSIVWVQE